MKEDIFDKAFEYVINFEGGFVSHSNDPGGDTKFGISRKSYPSLDIKNLTIYDAKEIYRRDFWLKSKCNLLHNEKIAIKFFDIAVNTGISNAVRLLQRAILASGVQLIEDGIIGSETIKYANLCNQEVLLAALKSEVAGYYRCLIVKNKSLYAFKKGWLKRAYAKIYTNGAADKI